MPDCATCPLFMVESEIDGCLHTNHPGGQRMTRVLIDSLELTPGARVLDLACGNGAALHLLNSMGFLPVGVDTSLLSLRHAQQSLAGMSILQAEGARLPFQNGSLDAVLIECAFSLANHSTPLLPEIFRVLKPGGCLAVADVYLREVTDPSALVNLESSPCLSGCMQTREVTEITLQAGLLISTWQDETALLKQWLAGIIFRLGSLKPFYQNLSSDPNHVETLERTLTRQVKLGYFRMKAFKPV